MNRQSLFFLQALWDADVQKEKILYLSQEASVYEIEHKLEGVLRSECLWVSEEANEIRRKIYEIKENIWKIDRPYQLIGYVDEYNKLIGEVHAMQIQTVRSITSDAGPMIKDLHVIVEPLFPLALKKIKEQMKYQLYRLLVLKGCSSNVPAELPAEDSLTAWIDFYKNKIYPQADALNDKQLDGRWAYEKKVFIIGKGIKIEQFVSVAPEDYEIKQRIGYGSIGTGEEGNLRIFGRGRMTNMTPGDLDLSKKIIFCNTLDAVSDFSFIGDENRKPDEILDGYFRGEKYLIRPDSYFNMINQYLILKTFQQRMELGTCMYCGMPLYGGICKNCGNRS